jgi:arsenate reductase
MESANEGDDTMSAIEIDVLVFEGCPHAEEAFELARSAASLAPGAVVRRVKVRDEAEGRRLQFVGSPTIRVNGDDIEGRTDADVGLSCRLYEGGRGVPPAWMVEAAILRALRPRHVLFLCVANSARSQIAEGIARALAPEGVRISSAGSSPGAVRPEAVAVLAEIGTDISAQRAKGLDEIERESVDAVITLCAEEVCPLWLGRAAKVHWALPDQASVDESGARLEAFRRTRDELRRRIELLFKQEVRPRGSRSPS